MILSGKIELTAANADAPVLHCPRCGSIHLHHLGVTVFERGEDADTIVRIVVGGSRTETDVVPNSGSGNPSSRRHGLAIQFSCENCSKDGDNNDVIELTVAQHKGCTEVGWRFAPQAV